jgi:hypothetical protein
MLKIGNLAAGVIRNDLGRGFCGPEGKFGVEFGLLGWLQMAD